MGCVTPMLFVLCVCGTLLSSYAVYIERSKEADNSYKAHCDLDETIACSHVLTSDYSRGLGGLVGRFLGNNHILNIPNSYIGLIFFPLLMILSLFSSKLVVGLSLLMTLVSVVSSAYLVYILVYVMKKICLVCMPIHIINLLTFILFTIKWRTVGSSAGEDRKKVQ